MTRNGPSDERTSVLFYWAVVVPCYIVKGQEWYQATEVAENYEDKRFSRGGRLIDRREKQIGRASCRERVYTKV